MRSLSIAPAAVAVVAALLVTARRSTGQSPSPTLGEVRGAFVAISVADLDASRRWYTETLGLHVVLSPPPMPDARALILGGGGFTVELVQLDRATPRVGAAEGTHGIFKAGVVVDDFDAVIARLRARGVTFAFGPYPSRDGIPANAIIKDNAGNLLQLFAR
jgi:catechol 2,3-dioxygenase-like lactoylglutathione lyase family enzyme